MLKQIRRLNRKNYFKLDKQTIQYEQNVLVCDRLISYTFVTPENYIIVKHSVVQLFAL